LGQEVVARLKNYDKVQRHLMGLEITEGGPPEADALLWSLDDVERQRVIGRVTSVVPDPSAPGGCRVLALVKRAYAHADQSLTVGSAEGPWGLVRVVDRWFWLGAEKPEIK
jgi:folate-binding Fe-S cluster repair protein YgfZ